MEDDLQAADPRCFRAARAFQAAWRGHTQRYPPKSRCLCHYVDRQFWTELRGTNVCPSCSVVWEEVSDRDSDLNAQQPTTWDDPSMFDDLSTVQACGCWSP